MDNSQIEKTEIFQENKLNIEDNMVEYTAFDVAKQLRKKKGEFGFLLNSETIISIFLASNSFKKWDSKDILSLFSCYCELLTSGEKITFDFYKKSYTNLNTAIMENATIIENKTILIEKTQKLLSEENNNLPEGNKKELGDKIGKLRSEIESRNENIKTFLTLLTHVDNALNMSVFDLAKPSNFFSSLTDFFLEEKNFLLSPPALKSFYIAYQDQFHRLDEKTVKFLIDRNDDGKEYMLGNLKTVTPALFREVVCSDNISATIKNQFATKIEIQDADEAVLEGLIFSDSLTQTAREKLCYNKAFSPMTCERLFFDSKANLSQKIALLSKVWPNKEEHMFQLTSMFRGDTFNALSKEQVESLIQTVWLSRGRSLGINPPVCSFEPMEDLLGCWYTYNVNLQKSIPVDSINAAGWFQIDLAKYNTYGKNKGINILKTIIHEMGHASQSKLKFKAEEYKTEEEKQISACYEITFSLLPYANVIFFASCSPVFVKNYNELVAEYNDPYFFKKKTFDAETYFECEEDFKMFLRAYSKAGITTLANDMAVAGEIIDAMVINKHKDAFNTISNISNPYHIYLNFLIELDARKVAIDYIKEVRELYTKRNEQCLDWVTELKQLTDAEKAIEHYGKDMEHAIIIVGAELAKSGIIEYKNLEEIDSLVHGYISSQKLIEKANKKRKQSKVIQEQKQLKPVTAKEGGNQYE